MNYKLEKF